MGYLPRRDTQPRREKCATVSKAGIVRYIPCHYMLEVYDLLFDFIGGNKILP